MNEKLLSDKSKEKLKRLRSGAEAFQENKEKSLETSGEQKIHKELSKTLQSGARAFLDDKKILLYETGEDKETQQKTDEVREATWLQDRRKAVNKKPSEDENKNVSLKGEQIFSDYDQEKQNVKSNREHLKNEVKSKTLFSDLNEQTLDPIMKPFEQNELGRRAPVINLQYMAEEVLKNVKIILHNNCLYYYTGKSYQLIKDDEELLRLIRSAVSHTAFGTTSTKKFYDLLRYLKADESLIPEDYDRHIQEAQYYVPLQNGILDLRTMELNPHSSKYLTFYQLDAEWKSNTEPKRFIKFLKSISGGEKEIALRIVETIGYILSPINSKYFFVMGTAPNSGKSTLGELLRRILGSDLVSSLAPHQLSERFALGDIQGKLLNLSMDLPKGKLNPVTVSIIKQITGGDTIAVEQKYEKIKVIKSNMRFLFASNYPVTVPQEDDDDGFWDRMIVLPFLYSVNKQEKDIQLIEKFMKEKSDIVCFCLQALRNVIEDKCILS